MLQINKCLFAILSIVANFWISWLYQLVVIFVARANFGVGAAVGAGAFALLSSSFNVVWNLLIFYYVFIRITPFPAEKRCVIRRISIFDSILPVEIKYLTWFFVICKLIETMDVGSNVRVGCVKQFIELLFLLVVKIMICNIDAKILFLILIINFYSFLQYFLNFHFDHLAF
jgi:hypothetical protein